MPATNFEKRMLMEKIAQMSDLPMPTDHIMKVMLLLRDENVSIEELVKAIEPDQTLVAKLLKMVNSGFYGLRKTVDSVERALTLLGTIQVKQIVYSATLMDIFSKDEQEEWDHSFSSFVLMTNIMKANKIPAKSNLPLTMLMHDIGKVVLRRFSPKKYEMAQLQAKEQNVPGYVMEDTLIKINHADTGALLLEKWQMLEDIIEPVKNHHTVEPPDDYIVETALLQFVDWIDNLARNRRVKQPSAMLMNAAGFEDVDVNYWVDYQEKLIENLENLALISKRKKSPARYSDSSSAETGQAGSSDTGTKKIDKNAVTDSSTEEKDDSLNSSENLASQQKNTSEEYSDTGTKKIKKIEN